MKTANFARQDFGLVVVQTDQRKKGAKRAKYVMAAVWRERLTATVDGKLHEEWVNVPMVKDDKEMPQRRLAAMMEAWRRMADNLAQELFT